MSRQTDGKSLYEQQEERILAQSDAFISLLTKRGSSVITKSTTKRFVRLSKRRTGKAITTHSCFFSIIEILPGYWSVCRWMLLQSWMSHLKVLTN